MFLKFWIRNCITTYLKPKQSGNSSSSYSHCPQEEKFSHQWRSTDTVPAGVRGPGVVCKWSSLSPRLSVRSVWLLRMVYLCARLLLNVQRRNNIFILSLCISECVFRCVCERQTLSWWQWFGDIVDYLLTGTIRVDERQSCRCNLCHLILQSLERHM